MPRIHRGEQDNILRFIVLLLAFIAYILIATHLPFDFTELQSTLLYFPAMALVVAMFYQAMV